MGRRHLIGDVEIGQLIDESWFGRFHNKVCGFKLDDGRCDIASEFANELDV